VWGVLKLLVVAVLAALPVTTPEEYGRLVVLETFQTPASSTIVLEYRNDTGRDLMKVRLECMLLDHRDAVVDTRSVLVSEAKAGAKVVERLRIVDSSQRASRAECRIASAR